MSTESAQPQSSDAKKARGFMADWWIYGVLAFFVGGLIAMTYFLTLRGDIINEFGKPGSHTEAPVAGETAPSAAPIAPQPAGDSSETAPARE